MRTPRPTARAAHAREHLRPADPDALLARFRFLRVLHPADPLIARQWRDVFPQCAHLRCRLDHLPEICRERVYDTRRELLRHVSIVAKCPRNHAHGVNGHHSHYLRGEGFSRDSCARRRVRMVWAPPRSHASSRGSRSGVRIPPVTVPRTVTLSAIEKRADRALFSAEREGFEPSRQFYPPNTLAPCRLRPLGHLSSDRKHSTVHEPPQKCYALSHSRSAGGLALRSLGEAGALSSNG